MGALPRESALVKAILGEPAEWTVNDYLTAHVVDGVNYLLHAFISANSKKKSPVPQPVQRPVERETAPRTRREKPRQSTPNEVSAFFGTTINAAR